MKRQVERVVFLSGAPPSAQSSYREQIICDLRGLVGETDLAQFKESYNKIKADYSDQENFLAYLERNWMSAEKLEMWSDAHRNVDNANMRTNNFIESWHNQLKTFFLGHRLNRRLDRLLHILITDVAFYHRSQFERISRMIGRMGPIHHANSMREYRADKVPTEDLQRRIARQNDGFYTVQSAGNGDIIYQVSIIDDLIHTCTCQDYQRRIQPCKHLYMVERFLERTIKVFLPSDLDIPINAHVPDTSVDSSDEEDLVNDDEIEEENANQAMADVNGQDNGASTDNLPPVVPRTDTENFLTMQDQFLTTMYHQRLPMSQLTSMTDEDAQRGTALFDQLREYYDEMFDKYNNHLRTTATQRAQRRQRR
jgi:hypothetical protein